MQVDQSTRRCKKCNSIKKIEFFPFYDSKKIGRRHECRDCNKIRVDCHHQQNKEHRLTRMRERYAKDPTIFWPPERRSRANDMARNRNKKLRKIIYAHYGDKCSCCGEREMMFLTLDHIDNNGQYMRKNVHGKASLNIYNWIIKNDYPNFFQLLCMNCNFGKARNGGICPHKSNEI